MPTLLIFDSFSFLVPCIFHLFLTTMTRIITTIGIKCFVPLIGSFFLRNVIGYSAKIISPTGNLITTQITCKLNHNSSDNINICSTHVGIQSEISHSWKWISLLGTILYLSSFLFRSSQSKSGSR